MIFIKIKNFQKISQKNLNFSEQFYTGLSPPPQKKVGFLKNLKKT